MFTDLSQQPAQQQVIGAAANDARVQATSLKAATDVAGDPRTQAAAMGVTKDAASDTRTQPATWNAARSVAQSAATQGAQQARRGFLEIRAHIQESHVGIRAYCFCVALALLVSSILGMFKVFDAVFSPFQYLWAVYNAIFAAMIIVMDGKPEWFSRCGGLQERLYRNAPFLATSMGRAALYFYVGSVNLLLLPDGFLWHVVYIGIGVVLCSIAGLMALQGCGCSCCQAPDGHAGP